MKHPVTVPEAATLEELGTNIGKLRYDALAVVLSSLQKELETQWMRDQECSRFLLAAAGGFLVGDLGSAARNARRMLALSLPHLEAEIKEQPLLAEPLR